MFNMQTEYEATFTEVDKEEMRNRLKEAGAILEKAEFLQRRSVFHLPEGHEITGGWARVRDEGDKVTMSIKAVSGSNIEDQKESCVAVDDFAEAEQFLLILGCKKKAYQETKRELWKMGDTEVTIDTWPFLEPFVEVEGPTQERVQYVSEQLGFNWSNARFCAVDTLYSEAYGVSEEVINDQTPQITFEMQNPFA